MCARRAAVSRSGRSQTDSHSQSVGDSKSQWLALGMVSTLAPGLAANTASPLPLALQGAGSPMIPTSAGRRAGASRAAVPAGSSTRSRVSTPRVRGSSLAAITADKPPAENPA